MTRTTPLIRSLLCAGALLAGTAAFAQEGPTTQELQQKMMEFVQWAQQQDRAVFQQNRELVAEKLREIYGDLDFQTLSLEQIGGMLNVAQFVPEWQSAIQQRLETLAQENTAEGAAASVMLVQSSLGGETEAAASALRTALTHPALGEALKTGQAVPLFQMLGYAPEETLAAVSEPVLGLADMLGPDVPANVAMSVSGYVTALNKLAEADAITAEQRRQAYDAVVAFVEAAPERLTDAEVARGMDENLRQVGAFLKGAFARGELIGHEAPELDFTWISGDEQFTSLDDLKGNVVVLDFWATWCGPCVASFPNVRQFVERYQGYPVKVIGVTSLQGRHYPKGGAPIPTEGDPEKEHALMAEYIEQNDLTWTIAFTEDDVFNPEYGVRGIPHMTIIDPEGKVVYNGIHPATPLEEKAAKVDPLLKKAGLPAPASLEAPATDEGAADEGGDAGGE